MKSILDESVFYRMAKVGLAKIGFDPRDTQDRPWLLCCCGVVLVLLWCGCVVVVLLWCGCCGVVVCVVVCVVVLFFLRRKD